MRNNSVDQSIAELQKTVQTPNSSIKRIDATFLHFINLKQVNFNVWNQNGAHDTSIDSQLSLSRDFPLPL